MIIGIDASRANEEKKTGVGWYAYHVIQELKHLSTQALEHSSTPQEMRFVLYTNKPLQGKLADLPENWNEKVLRWFPGRLWTQFRMSWEMLWHAPDVLFIPAHVFPIIHPKKTVMTIHDIAATKFPEAYNWFEKWYTLWSARFALKNLWKVITISEFTKSELTGLQVSKFASSKIKVVYHGYNVEYKNLKENKVEIEQKLNKYNINKPYLLSIGRLEEKKNTVKIIQAFNLIKSHNLQSSTCLPVGKVFNLQLVLVGGEGFGYEKVKEAIDNSKFKNDIITPGWVENDDLPYLMSGAEVFVFPSLYEGFGIPVLEAMACGTPVVTSGENPSALFDSVQGRSLRTATQEVGGDACIYVDPQNVEEISDSILKIIEDINFRQEKIELGLQRVGEFSWEKCARETFDVLLSED